MAGLGSTTVLHQLGHPDKRTRVEQSDTHEQYNSKVDALTHQLNDAMALCVSFRRALRGHTTVWYEPLEEENVGHGGSHEVTGNVYKHITGSAQQHLSIERVGVKDGVFLATFGKGAIGRARSESRSTFVSKLMHEHLATEARQEMWAGQTKGSVTCGCGHVIGWAAPDEVSRLQWHMLEYGLPSEAAIRTRWHTDVRGAIQTDQAPRRGRRRHGLLGDDSRAHPHSGRRSEPRLACAANGRGGGLRQLVPGPCRPAAVLQPGDEPTWGGWRRRGRLGRWRDRPNRRPDRAARLADTHDSHHHHSEVPRRL
jgi:hypothetical protein